MTNETILGFDVIFCDERSGQHLKPKTHCLFLDEKIHQNVLGQSSVLLDMDQNGQISQIKTLNTDTHVENASFEFSEENQRPILTLHGLFPKAYVSNVIS
jgi:hypothetical protein